jgi:hypothetical protein
MKFYAKPKFVRIRGEWYVFWRGGYAKGSSPADAWSWFSERV